MAVSPESVNDSLTRAGSSRRVRFGNVEPAAVALLKQLDPLVAVLSLFVCVLAYGQPLGENTLGLGVLTFLIASPIFARSPRHKGIPGSRLYTTYSRILVEWGMVVAILLFLGFAFRATETFSRFVLVAWFVATPAALLASHGLRLRAHSILAATPRTPLHHRRRQQCGLRAFPTPAAERLPRVLRLPQRRPRFPGDRSRQAGWPLQGHRELCAHARRDRDLHRLAAEQRAAHRRDDPRAARHDRLHLLPARRLRLRPDPGSAGGPERHARDFGVRHAVPRHGRGAQAHDGSGPHGPRPAGGGPADGADRRSA